MILSLKEKNAVICGSTQGIGLAVAKELALLGANCILLARNESSLQQAVSLLDVSQGQQHEYAVADFSNSQEVKTAIEKIVRSKTIHILINNTGGPAPVRSLKQRLKTSIKDSSNISSIINYWYRLYCPE